MINIKKGGQRAAPKKAAQAAKTEAPSRWVHLKRKGVTRWVATAPELLGEYQRHGWKPS